MSYLAKNVVVVPDSANLRENYLGRLEMEFNEDVCLATRTSNESEY